MRLFKIEAAYKAQVISTVTENGRPFLCALSDVGLQQVVIPRFSAYSSSFQVSQAPNSSNIMGKGKGKDNKEEKTAAKDGEFITSMWQCNE